MLCRYCDSFSLHMDFCRFCRWRTEAKTVRALTPLLKSGEVLTLIVCYLCGSFQSIWYDERTVHLCRILVPLGIGGESSAFYILWHTAACRSVDPLKSYPEMKTILEHMLTYLLPCRRALCSVKICNNVVEAKSSSNHQCHVYGRGRVQDRYADDLV